MCLQEIIFLTGFLVLAWQEHRQFLTLVEDAEEEENCEEIDRLFKAVDKDQDDESDSDSSSAPKKKKRKALFCVKSVSLQVFDTSIPAIHIVFRPLPWPPFNCQFVL